MPRPKKGEKKNESSGLCIVHNESQPESQFISLKNIQGTVADKLNYLKQIRDKRLSEPEESPYRMSDVCSRIPPTVNERDFDKVGYHKLCYKSFTKNLDRLKLQKEVEDSQSLSQIKIRSPRKRKSTEILFPDECIFCGFKFRSNDKTLKNFPSFKNKEAKWKNIESQALELGETQLYRKVQGQDLFAREAKFHESCENDFKIKYMAFKRGKSDVNKLTAPENDNCVASAHKNALKEIIDLVEVKIIQNKEILQLNDLRSIYVECLRKSGFPCPQFRSERLKKIMNDHDIGKKISFTNYSPGNKGYLSYVLVYSAALTTSEGVKYAYKVGNTDQFKNTAVVIRECIIQAFKKRKELPWPPSIDDLSEVTMPKELISFLEYVFNGLDAKSDARVNRVIMSIGQDICRETTRGEWKLPKHILLANTIHHLYRGKKLMTIINRLGHCESYSFSIELHNAVAMALKETSLLLTPQIVKGDANIVFHMEWDNLNKITTNIHGNNVVNHTGGIMIQEVKENTTNINCHERLLPTYDRSDSKRLQPKDVPEKIAPLQLYKRVGPKISKNAIFRQPDSYVDEYKKCLNELYIWFIARAFGSSLKQQLVPAFGGFVSITGMAPKRKSTIDYFTPIDQPFTDYGVVRELLKRSEKATDAVGQYYVLNTFDLGGCMKALPIIWKYPDEYKRHIVTPGPFHTTMNYIGMVTGHKFNGSGYAELLLESKLATSGCLKGILSGKAYAKALFALNSVCEALQRMLFEKFLKEEFHSEMDFPSSIQDLISDCSRNNLNLIVQDETVKTLIQTYKVYEQKVRDGYLGKTATFWFSLIDHYRLITMIQFSVKTNNLTLFHKCNSDMADLFFAYDGPNYSRYLVWLDLFLLNIDMTHPGAKTLLEKGGIAVARSLLPGALSAVDKTMEETFMKFAKSSGGFSGLFHNSGAYERWCRTTSVRAQYHEKLLEMCGLDDDPDHPRKGKHRDLEKAEICKSENAVQRVIAAINNFTNPFEIPDKDKLYNLASGAPVSSAVETDVLQAERKGKEQKEEFVKNRLMSGRSSELFFEPISRLNLKTMAECNKKVKLTSSEGKIVQYKQQSDLAFMLLVKSQLQDDPLDLNELLTYSLFPVPYILGTPDGFFAKTNKAKMLHFLLEEYTDHVEYPENSFHIEDGNALVHSLRDLPPTFGEICLLILDQLKSKRNFLFSTDSYFPDSIKSQERLRRGFSQKHIINGPLTRKPKDMKLFLSNDENKKQLFELLLNSFKSDASLKRIEQCERAILVVDGKAYDFFISNGKVVMNEIVQLQSNQEETDTRVVLYLEYAAEQGFKSAVVRTPDTDIFFILLYHASSIDLEVFLDTGSGKHRKIVNVSDIAREKGPDYCTTLLGLYVFTGEDATSAFKGKGKVGPLKKLNSNPVYHQAFKSLGDNWNVSDELCDKIEAFTCLMFGYAKEKKINTVRGKILKKMIGEDSKLTLKSKVDLSKLPPAADNLKPHIYRVNHRVATYKRANQAVYPMPKPWDDKQGWVKNDDGILEPLWSLRPVLPLSLVDILENTVEELDNESSDNENELEIEAIDIEEMFEEEEDFDLDEF